MPPEKYALGFDLTTTLLRGVLGECGNYVGPDDRDGALHGLGAEHAELFGDPAVNATNVGIGENALGNQALEKLR